MPAPTSHEEARAIPASATKAPAKKSRTFHSR